MAPVQKAGSPNVVSGWPMAFISETSRSRRTAYAFAAFAATAGIVVFSVALRRAQPPAEPVLTQTLGAGLQPADARSALPPARSPVLHGVEAPPGLVATETVMSFDFDASLPAGVTRRYGEITRCPPVGAGRCLGAVRYDPPHQERVGVQLSRTDGPLFTYDDDLYLRFDYWAGSTTGQPYRVQVEVSDPHDKGATDVIFQVGPSVTWNRALIPLASLSWSRDRQVTLPRGFGIQSLQLVLWFSTNDLFLVDNLEVVRFRPQR